MALPVAVPAVGDFNTAGWGDDVANTVNGTPYFAYTPVLSATTTSPTLGTGSSVVGRYCHAGDIVNAYVIVRFGTSGTAAGSGTYHVTLPVTPETAGSGGAHLIGYGKLFCAGLFTPVLVGADGSLRYISAAVNGTSITATNALPGAWTANDFIELNLMYEAA